MKFTIERKLWWRGNGSKESKLLRDDGNMCCLGFYLKACGANLVNNAQTPEEQAKAGDNYPAAAEWLLYPDEALEHGISRDCEALMHINDYPTEWKDGGPRTEEEREQMLRCVFAEHGIEVEFVD